MTQKYKNASSTADIIVERDKKILLIKRKHAPYRGMWALPGGFHNCGKETLEEAAKREFLEETGLFVRLKDLKQFGWYSNPERDPRGHVIAHVYIAKNTYGSLKAGDDAGRAVFFPFNALPELAFDHNKIIKDYTAWRKKAKYTK